MNKPVQQQMIRVSIIIPVLNEAEHLPAILAHLSTQNLSACELILVDGGSQDDTLAIAASVLQGMSCCYQILSTDKGRALQMNAGAESARGDLLLFLHADTCLPDKAIENIVELYSDKKQQQSPRLFWGYFNVCLSGSRVAFRIIETFINYRSRLTSVATGDQCLFVDSRFFRLLGGFPAIELMEDIAISKKLRQRARAVHPEGHAHTSSRRWESRGIISTVWLMWRLRFLYFIGVSPAKLQKMYR